MRTWLKDPRQIPVAELDGVERGLALLLRNWYWGHTHGWANLMEEHDLNPLVRIPRDLRKLGWRLTRGVEPGQAHPILLFGAQRSGTNMVTHGLAMAPEVEVYNEGDRRAFDRYRIRGSDRLSRLMMRSRHRYVLFKPLLDTHRAVELLDDVEWNKPPRAIWVYRDVRERARSAVVKFGDSNLRVLRRRAANGDYQHWQLGDQAGLSRESATILDSVDAEALSPMDGAALFWLIRNRLFFELALADRDDVLLVSYERFLAKPGSAMSSVCRFLDFPFRSSLIDHVRRPAPTPGGPSEISPHILHLCDELMDRLIEAEGTS